jgi:hypothetical protein
MFKRMLIAALLVAPLCAIAADDKAGSAKPMTEQQEKMGSCNKDASAKDLKGDDRKKFMKECLSAGKKEAKMTQQEKMKACNKDAGEKSLKGDDRKHFMSECLKGDGMGEMKSGMKSEMKPEMKGAAK